jgi:hypothetical protein
MLSDVKVGPLLDKDCAADLCRGTSMKLSRLLGVACLSLLVSGTTGAQQPDTCPHSGEWIPKKEELQQILSEHVQWTEQVNHWMWAQSLDRDPETVLPKWAEEIPGRANLCNARLEDVKLNDANLAGAQLNNAVLIGVELNKANLRYAELNGALLSSRPQCRHLDRACPA